MRKLGWLAILAGSVLLLVGNPTSIEMVFSSPRQLDAVPGITVYPGAPCTPLLLWQADGDSAGDSFGQSVAGDGDWDGDGGSDILVGSPYGHPESEPAGCASGYINYLTEEWHEYGNFETEFGRSIAFMGDIDNDAAGEAVIGAPFWSGAGYDSNGAVSVFGRATGLKFSWLGSGSYAEFGYSVAGISDVDGDLYGDILVGAPIGDGAFAPNTGYAQILSPRQNNVVYTFNGTEVDSRFGHAVAYGGAIDDFPGYDVIIGAPLSHIFGPTAIQPGAVFAYRTDGTLIWRFNGEGDGDMFGFSVSGTEDYDGDGYNEIIIGAPNANPDGQSYAGAVYVYSGISHALLYRVEGVEPYGHFGCAVSGICDVDGDDYDDFVVGANREAPGGRTDAGAAYVCSGADGAFLWKFEGAAAGDLFGTSVSYRVDNAIDNACEILIGAPGADPDGRTDAGSAYLFGCDCNCPWQADYDANGVLDAIDLNGLIDALFFGGPDPQDQSCPTTRGDFNNDGAPDALDLNALIDHLFFGADGPCDPCDPVQGTCAP